MKDYDFSRRHRSVQLIISALTYRHYAQPQAYTFISAYQNPYALQPCLFLTRIIPGLKHVLDDCCTELSLSLCILSSRQRAFSLNRYIINVRAIARSESVPLYERPEWWRKLRHVFSFGEWNERQELNVVTPERHINKAKDWRMYLSLRLSQLIHFFCG